MIRAKASKTHEQDFLKFCDSLGLEVTASVGKLFYVKDPADPESYWIVCARPADPKPFTLRRRTSDHFDALQAAMNAKKLYIMRYDPKKGLKAYNPATEDKIRETLEPYNQEINTHDS